MNLDQRSTHQKNGKKNQQKQENQKQDQQKKVLLRVTGLKMYFPVKKTSIFQRHQQYVMANDKISLEIYEGETLGLVGESGCGKSTFGRVLLQLYQQTEGEVIYYGKSIKEMLPEYRLKIYQNLPKYVKTLRILKKQETSVYEEMSFSDKDQMKGFPDKEQMKGLHGKKNKLRRLEKMLAEAVGGFLCSDDIETVSKLLVEQFDNWNKQRRIRDKLGLGKKLELEYHKQQSKRAELEWQLEQLISEEATLERRLNEIKQECQSNADFNRHEKEYERGIHLKYLTENELRNLRKDLQLVFQDPYSSLNPRMTVGQLIGEGVRTHKLIEHHQELEHYVTRVMENCGLSSYMIHRYPHQFSGGQRQRIGIARSLALHPKFVVCDEAVSALDVSIQSQILNLLVDLKKKENLTYLFISHDLSVIRYVSDRIGVMYLGRLVELSKSKDLFEHPLHPYTRALLSAIPTVDGKAGPAIELQGELPSPMNPPTGCTFHTRCQYCTEICMKQEPEWEELREGHMIACHHAKEMMKSDDISRAAN